jgi:23S rRNA A2030 N6-methylase RlmJ
MSKPELTQFPSQPARLKQKRCLAWAISVLLVLGVFGCASTALQRQREVQQSITRIMQECRTKRLAGELPNYVASARCSNDRIRQVRVESGDPYMDLTDLYLAHRMALARRIDNGELSEEDTQLQLAELRTRLNSEAQQRDAITSQTRSQQLQSYGVYMQGLQSWSQSWQPRRPVTCYRSLNTFTCY